MVFCIFFLGALRANKVWSGGQISGATAFVLNENLSISGTNELVTPGRIVNTVGGSEMVVTVTTTDAIVTSSLQLYVSAVTNSIITFSITNDLIFCGSQADFLITMSGAGTLQFYIEGGNTVSFTALPTVHGTTFLTLADSGYGATTTFGRFPTLGAFGAPETNLHSYLEVGSGSVVSTAATAAAGSNTAQIIINPANLRSGTGRFVLHIKNNASFIIEPATIATTANPTLASITYTNPLAGGASLVIDQTSPDTAYAGLLIVNDNTTWTGLESNPFCELVPTSTTVARRGFILGPNATLTVADQSYIDYVVTVTNITIYPNIPSNILNNPCQRFVTEVVKDRNAAAFIVDGLPTSTALVSPAQIIFEGNSAIYFRSGVDCQGVTQAITPADVALSFTISSSAAFTNEGTIVFDVEGPVDIYGDPTGESALQILSLQVSPTGGSVLITSSDINFPLRTFATDANGNYLQYGSACFMVNNLMNLRDSMHLQQTDEIHPIYEDNLQGQSSPCYIGGDRKNFLCGFWPYLDNRIQFFDSFFDLHTSAAVVGLDLTVPSQDYTVAPNSTQFVFYQNGRCIDNGTGRNLILGTEVGCQASDCKTIVDRDAHLDLFQSVVSNDDAISLNLTTSTNNTKITQGITGNISTDNAVQTLFLAYNSNISIGTQDSTFIGLAPISFTIAGDFFSLTSQGGSLQSPETTIGTGQGGMFVDLNGTVSINPNLRANIGMMVLKSLNGVINLPKNQIFFAPRVGTGQWDLNLNDASQRIIISASQALSDYTIDWKNLKKDFCATPAFVPYEPVGVPLPGASPAVTSANLTGLPLILGSVDQLQIKNSRLGDQVHLEMNGALVREFVFLTGSASATAPVGVLVLENNALVGLGTAARNVDSLDASVVLGINGVILLPNGDATIRLNVNTIINNLCHIVTGTLFGTNGNANRLLIDSVVPTELRIKTGGVLDLTQLTSTAQTLMIGGQVNMVLEPGAEILMGGGNLVFTGNSQVFCEPDTSIVTSLATTLTATDAQRVKFTGNGRVTFKENATFTVPRGALVGIETTQIANPVTYPTQQSWLFSDDALFFLGSDAQYGGGFQIGDTVSSTTDVRITYSLIFDGVGSTLDLNSQGFFGCSVGIAAKPPTAPNTWLVNNLYNVDSVTLTLTQGTFKNQQIYDGDNKLAGLLAIGQARNATTNYFFTFDATNADILGGGNVILTTSAASAFAPTVLSTAGSSSANVTAGIQASKATLLDYSKEVVAPLPVPASATQLFNYLTANDYASQNGKTAAIFRNQLGGATVGFVFPVGVVNTIRREAAGGIQGLNGVYVNPNNSLAIGAVGIYADPLRGIVLSQINPQQ